MDDIYNLSKSELTNLLDHNGFPSYRADQIWRYLYKNYVINFEEMNNIKFSKNTTDNDLSKRSFVQSFLQSIKQKMYSGRGKGN